MYVYYRCRHDNKLSWVRHPQQTRSVAQLDSVVWRALMCILQDPEVLHAALLTGQTQDPHAGEVHRLTAEGTRIEGLRTSAVQQQRTLVDLASLGQGELTAVATRLKELQTQQQQYEAELARLAVALTAYTPPALPTLTGTAELCQRMATTLVSRD